MKIKAVCQATGLTDRTVRYYIEEGLIAPDYTENYLGRRTFDFSERDIRQLDDIAVLRKFGFSVAEIREMLLHPEDTLRIVEQLQSRKKALIDEEQTLLQMLLRVDPAHAYTVSELAAFLSAPVEDAPVPAEDSVWNIRGFVMKAVRTMLLFAAAWVPVVMTCIGLVDAIRWYYYSVIDPLGIILTGIVLLPALLLMLLPKLGKPGKRKEIAKWILVALCVLSIPICRFMPVTVSSCSHTTDFRNYRDLDPECLANRSMLFQELFPTWPHYFENVKQPDGSWEDVYLDASYYYMYTNSWDYTYDIIAEWPLPEEEFHAEVERVQAIFAERGHTVMEKGNYTCLIVHYGSPLFEEVTTSYTYYIFAYDEENLRVRYICCDSLDDGADQPYYLQLDWT